MNSSRVLFKISVHVGDKEEDLLVHGSDCPELICEEFAKTHKLSLKAQEELLTGINSCIDELAQSPNHNSTSFASPTSQASSVFLRLSKPKSPMQGSSPALHQLESANSTKKRYHLLCKHKKQSTHSFKPELNKKTLKIANSGKITPNKQSSHKCLKNEQKTPIKTQKMTEEQGKQVANRLIGYLKVKEKKLDELRMVKEKEQSEFFKPSINNRPKSVNSPKKKKPDFEFVNEKLKKILNLNEKNESSRSADIIKYKKKKRYKEIFNVLAQDSNVLHIRNAALGKVDQELLKVIYPLLEELAEADSGLEFRDFCVAMDNLMKLLNVSEKNVILDTRRKKSYKPNQFSFKPETCSSSFNIKSSLLERSSLMLVKKELGYKKGQEDKVINDLSNCTFTPKTTKYIRSMFYPNK